MISQPIVLLIVSVLTVIFGILYVITSRGLRQEKAMHEFNMKLMQNELTQYRNIVTSIRTVLERNTGGVFKRLSENQEMAKILHDKAPGLFQDEYSRTIAYSLQAHHEFFAAVADVAKIDNPKGGRDSKVIEPIIYGRLLSIAEKRDG